MVCNKSIVKTSTKYDKAIKQVFVTCLCFVAFSTALVSPAAGALQIFTWNGSQEDGNWSRGGNWTGYSGPPNDGNDQAYFELYGQNNQPILNDYYTIGQIKFYQGGWIIYNAGSYTLSISNTDNDGVAIISNNNGPTGTNYIYANINLLYGNQDIQNQSGNNLYIYGTLSGYGFNKTGDGKLILAGNNNYTGATTVSTGVLNIQHSSALGGTTNGTTVANNAALELQNNITVASESLSLTGTGVSSTGALRSISGTNAWNGSVTLAANSSIGVDSGSTLTVGGAITGSGYYLTKVGSGTLVLSNSSNSFNGTYVTGGTLRLGASNVLPGTLSITSATVDLNGKSETISDITLSSGVISGSGTLTLSTSKSITSSGTSYISGGTLALGTTSHDVTVTDTLTIGSAITDSGQIVKKGTGVLVLSSSSNSYSGGTYVNAGTLQLAANNVLPDYGLDVTATVDFNGYSDTVGTLTLNGGTVQNFGTLTLAGNVSHNSGTQASLSGTTIALGATRTLSVVSSSTLSVDAAVSGSGCGLTKDGAGTLILAGNTANTYSGVTTVNRGTLKLQKTAGAAIAGNISVGEGSYTATLSIEGSNQIASTAAAAIGSYGTMKLNSNNTTLASLSGSGGVELGSGSLTISGSTTTTFSGSIKGTGTLVHSGSGQLTLTSENTYSGGSQITGGTLVAAHSKALGTGNIQVDGGTFIVGSSADLTNQVTATAGTVQGTGIIRNLLVNGATLSPGNSPGLLTVGQMNMMSGSLFLAELNGLVAGDQYDQLLLTGIGTIDSADLKVSLGFDPAFGDSFTIIDNRGSLSGQFFDLPESSIIKVGRATTEYLLRISYVGGDGNDVVLTVVPEPAMLALLIVAASTYAFLTVRRRVHIIR